MKKTTSAHGPEVQESFADLEPQRHQPKSLAELNMMIAAAKPMVHGGHKAVLGEGRVGAPLALVGEQPGDQEDLQGRPFVGPAGRLLDRALEAAGVDRKDTYVTNAVKHFKYVQRGKRRIHQKPTVGEVKHYRWWLLKELEFVHPHLVVALGATAALALSGAPVVISRNRGAAQFGEFRGFITVHPSSLLRHTDKETRDAAYTSFVHDLRSAARLAAPL
ncbi:UdgX family uracil-DNA binding protein [Hyphomicrobium sp.]|jgi:DNA polymerase|uniref:UdgX family uracil-DNA binding protein n=1 Tax=Hyphomicrobium sp. TaxID=82 RepID=UPI002C62C28B|nr:UdgX family uracil-DNA binding protein [Hyphomicrobium sp.]HVZ04336.1 UdgX family uracil-DNA binding protein [Hyphomicrobium sp.]